MSLITQCPACSTMFRVVPDQLRISEGWVRCGQCDEVFDANAHLRSLEEAASTLTPAVPEPVEAEPEPIPQAEAFESTVLAPMQAEAEPAYDWGPLMSEPDALEGPTNYIPPATLVFEPEVASEPHNYSLSTDPLLQPELQDPPLPPDALDAAREPAAVDLWEPTEMASLAPDGPQLPVREAVAQAVQSEDALPSFMTAPRDPGRAGNWPGRKSLLALSSLLVAVLAFQALVLERNRIAVTVPALRPMLAAGCEVLACNLSPLQEIESIAIDSSAFTSIRPGAYLLQVTLKNSSNADLATPALELTLTDTQDRPLLRRVLLPTEISDKPSLAGGSELGAKLPISVKPGSVPEKIAGYKLLAFYP